MTIKTNIKAGVGPVCPVWGCGANHNQTQLRSLRIKTSVKTGRGPICPVWGCGANHNQRQLRIKSSVKAGYAPEAGNGCVEPIQCNHDEALVAV